MQRYVLLKITKKPAKYLIWDCLKQQLMTLSRFLYSEKAPFQIFDWVQNVVQRKKPEKYIMLHLNSPIQAYLQTLEKWIVWKPLVFSYYSEKYIQQRFSFNQMTKVSTITFSRGRRRCNMTEISLNRILRDLENKLMD